MMVVNEVVVEEAGVTTNVVIVVQLRMGQANGVVRCIYPEIRMLMSTLTWLSWPSPTGIVWILPL